MQPPFALSSQQAHVQFRSSVNVSTYARRHRDEAEAGLVLDGGLPQPGNAVQLRLLLLLVQLREAALLLP